MRKSIGIISEVSQILTDAFTQNKAGNYQAALEGFLKVGENTKMQRTEAERQVYVCSQTMAVFCFEQLKQYDKGIQLSETLLQGKLLDNEREDIQHLYVMNGYFKATSCLKKTSRRYTDAREVLTKILPYADGDMKIDTTVKRTTEAKVGDRVLSSGYGSVYPRGLVIGFIESMEVNPYTRGMSVTVRCAADFSELSRVMILTDFDTKVE